MNRGRFHLIRFRLRSRGSEPPSPYRLRRREGPEGPCGGRRRERLALPYVVSKSQIKNRKSANYCPVGRVIGGATGGGAVDSAGGVVCRAGIFSFWPTRI